MEIDDRAAMAALLATARDVLHRRVRPALDGDAALDAAMIANALALVVRALEQPGTAWSRRGGARTGSVAERVRALRPQVAARLAVTNPTYPNEIADSPP
ncbi:MAG: hypothetical protein GVY33_13500 [Alphaproteobacteria bacterium]|jgi:hypothetical protein|nr:hypothetical protein [Alphaproteobacteria bacterium]